MALAIGRRQFIVALGGAAVARMAARGTRRRFERSACRRICSPAANGSGELWKHAGRGWTNRLAGGPKHPYRVAICRQTLQPPFTIGPELAALNPDVIFVTRRRRPKHCNKEAQYDSGHLCPSMLTRSAPASSQVLARPGGNITGILLYEDSIVRQMARDAQGDCTHA